MQRILLFLLTNIAIMVILSITLRILGVESLLVQNGSDLNVNALVIFSGVFGFGGAFISLAISKWMAKTSYSSREDRKNYCYCGLRTGRSVCCSTVK